MSPLPRAILYEPNRYRSLLVQRALTEELGPLVVARFSVESEALDDLCSNTYHLALVNLDALEGDCDRFFQKARRANPELLLITIASPETPRRLLEVAEKYGARLIVWQPWQEPDFVQFLRSVAKSDVLEPETVL